MKHPLLTTVLLFLPLAAQDSPDSVLRPAKRFDKRVISSGLAGPWELTWGPDSMLWVTERTGKRISRINPATGERSTAITIDEVATPGGQDGLLGLALHPNLLKGTNHVYVSYTYIDKKLPADARVKDLASPYRHLYGKIVRFLYDPATGKMSQPRDLITGLPAGNDHNAYRLKFGPDQKLYMAIGDQGNNQLGNFCNPILSQRLPTAKEIASRDYAAYEGKTLRLNLDGSIPRDNAKLNGVVSHVFSYGHRNTQGLDFGPDGTLYAAEHGPKTDDEINIITKGSNYGWPHVAGLRDNKAYQYARWAEASTPCSQLRFSDLSIHPAVPRQDETDFKEPMVEPIATMFTVPTGFNFENPACGGIHYICWPTVGISSMEFYGNRPNLQKAAVPGWDAVLFITTLKRGSLYVQPLSADRKHAAGPMSRYFQSENRYRDTAIHPDGKTIFIATDPDGLTESASGGVTTNMMDKGAILAFTYAGEGAPVPEQTIRTSAPTESAAARAKPTGPPPAFTAEQVANGKKSYESNCAVCHGSTLSNGTFGTPLAGAYFEKKWLGKSVAAFYNKSATMPPAAPGSLPQDVYADILAYILEFNGAKPGTKALSAGDESLKTQQIQ